MELYPQAGCRADVHDSQHRLEQNRIARIPAGVSVGGHLRSSLTGSIILSLYNQLHALGPHHTKAIGPGPCS